MHSKTPESRVDNRGLSIPLHEVELPRGPEKSGPLGIAANREERSCLHHYQERQGTFHKAHAARRRGAQDPQSRPEHRTPEGGDPLAEDNGLASVPTLG